jgi:arylformamidase
MQLLEVAMHKKIYWVILLSAAVLPACLFSRLSGPIPAQTDPTPPQMTPISTTLPQTTPVGISRTPAFDLIYARYPGADPKLTSLDVYPPSTGENLPVMIFVHGGGWSIGDKRYVEVKPQAFNQAGYLFISINYRMLPEAEVPTQAGDVATVIAWVHEHAAAYGGDPQQIFLMGHSSGAHLVSLVGTDPSYLEIAGLSLKALRGVVALDTQAYDIQAVMQDLSGLEGPIYRQAFGNDPAFWKKVSPISYVEAGHDIPSFFVAYSGQGADRPELAESFVAALKQAGISAEILPATDKTHLEINQQFGEPGDPVTQAVMAFLAKIRQ